MAVALDSNSGLFDGDWESRWYSFGTYKISCACVQLRNEGIEAGEGTVYERSDKFTSISVYLSWLPAARGPE